MKILVLNGSPKKKSDTFHLTDAFLKGMNKEQKHDVTVINVIEKNIAPCQGCFGCWAKMEGHCVINDDQNAILDLYKDADLIIWSFPLYCYAMPSHLKALLDRTIPLVKMKMVQGEDGTVTHEPLAKFEKAGEAYSKDFTLTAETIAELERPMISKEDYIRNVNGG